MIGKIREWFRGTKPYGTMSSHESVDSDLERRGFRRIGMGSFNPLRSVNQQKLIKRVKELYYKNPMVRRLVTVPRDYSYKISIKVKSTAHEDLQKVIDRFWYDPINRMPQFIGDLQERYELDGELLLPVTVNNQDGLVRLTYVPPELISNITVFQDDMRQVDTIEVASTMAGTPPKKYKAIRVETDPNATVVVGSEQFGNRLEVKSYGFRVGDAFYFRQCHLITERGRSPLEPLLIWIEAHDQAFWDQLMNLAFANVHMWDITLRGANASMCEKKLEELENRGRPKSGAFNVHNDSETWQVLSPQIKSNVAAEILTGVRKYIGLGAAKSETWMAASDQVSRASAMVSDDPPLRHLAYQQFVFEQMIRDMIDFQIDQAILHGTLPILEPEERAYDVVMPDVNVSDNRVMSEAVRLLAEGLRVAVFDGLCDKQTARDIFYSVVGRPIPDNIDELIRAEKQQQALDDYEPPPISQYVAARPTVERDGLP